MRNMNFINTISASNIYYCLNGFWIIISTITSNNQYAFSFYIININFKFKTALTILLIKYFIFWNIIIFYVWVHLLLKSKIEIIQNFLNNSIALLLLPKIINLCVKIYIIISYISIMKIRQKINFHYFFSQSWSTRFLALKRRSWNFFQIYLSINLHFFEIL